MAYIGYAQQTAGGKQLAECMYQLQEAADNLRNLAAWIGQIGVAALESNADFNVTAGDAQAFNDTVVQINTDLVAFMTTNREKIERLARGA
jgi:uncharacterized phage infection (PIP) family protein YhgE